VLAGRGACRGLSGRERASGLQGLGPLGAGGGAGAWASSPPLRRLPRRTHPPTPSCLPAPQCHYEKLVVAETPALARNVTYNRALGPAITSAVAVDGLKCSLGGPGKVGGWGPGGLAGARCACTGHLPAESYTAPDPHPHPHPPDAQHRAVSRARLRAPRRRRGVGDPRDDAGAADGAGAGRGRPGAAATCAVCWSGRQPREHAPTLTAATRVTPPPCLRLQDRLEELRQRRAAVEARITEVHQAQAQAFTQKRELLAQRNRVDTNIHRLLLEVWPPGASLARQRHRGCRLPCLPCLPCLLSSAPL
jgi:hypothetical protein